ncbi:DctP family TRAP transporter solute-binding subunit [Deferribacterales bacterium Es71-Z0220]|jgi:C4-dicarboxylate-binding protein DctP|uniref:DctP family TRAP transporter solute-binding subunit n=1 Tax=Deferrivibrio essentukiensis TaxID=2880922 RepID=UPI001F623E9C|nr:DctP family TRAP transporter solute-binding subunit [Deferrivibrio essentukiensis]MBZ4672583.1 dicarboxylate transporter, DctP subunit [Deferribacteraceae bacterium]MCB4204100.1 DctP family TRAP transporter solute-binding subunit [Deferrivibrio essentukiensis]
MYVKKLFIIILLTFTITSFAETKIVIKFSHVVSENSPKGKAVLYFKNLVEKKSDGRISVQIFPRGVLFDDITVVEALKNDIVQMAAPSFSKLSFYVKDFQLFDIPFLFKNIYSIHRAYSGNIGEILKRNSEGNGIKVLAFWDNGFKHITNNSKVIKLPNDMKGLKFRTMGSDILNYQFSLAGAKPYTKSFSNLKSLLEEGVIDGQENTFSNIYYQKMYEVQRYLTVSKHGYLGYAVITSMKFWNSIDKELQDIILEALEISTHYEYKLAIEDNERSFEMIKLEAKDLEIHYIDDKNRALWVKFYKRYHEKFTNVISQEILKELDNL